MPSCIANVGMSDDDAGKHILADVDISGSVDSIHRNDPLAPY